MNACRSQLRLALVAAAAATLMPLTAEAQITRIVIDRARSESPTFEGRAFGSNGSVGQYEKLRGKAYGELDLERFERLAAEGQEALATGDPAAAAAALRAAEELWTGRPLADLEFERLAQVGILAEAPVPEGAKRAAKTEK